MKIYTCFVLIVFNFQIHAQTIATTALWHNKQRNIHYQPEGNNFVCQNGTMRFNRALYGTNTAFRVEAGDLPEFAMYMPGMGGDFKFGLINKGESKWLINANYIKAIYNSGSMIYEIKDSMLGNGVFKITILALANAEGMIIKTESISLNKNIDLLWAFGGASGKKFSRDGDIGADPESSFYLQADNCKDNIYQIKNNTFNLSYGSGKILTEEERYEINNAVANNKEDALKKNPPKNLIGIVPKSSTIILVDASQQNNPLQLLQSKNNLYPAIAGTIKINNEINYFLIENPSSAIEKNNTGLAKIFDDADLSRNNLANRIKVNTPDEYINTLGGALSMASDAIWEDPSYMHGAVAWRMRLNAWRGPYTADPLGWHDRARKHFSSYALSQVTAPQTMGVVADTALHLARQLEKIGTALFSDGYICRNPNGDIRAHHYDMNLVFIDQLLNHFNWTGDTTFVKKMWPLLQCHLAWEKRNFDADGDGLYDAYAAIWASDALQYSGGDVTHSSAYNYRANKNAADLANLIGEDAAPYKKEANHILQAMNKNLWMQNNGWYAEYKDALGLKLLHPSAALWTIYTAIDSKTTNTFQAYQCLQYIKNNIPHIPVIANGLNQKNMFLLATTNWQPYTWSLNNVALAENLHTALSFWQAGDNENAFQLWKSSLVESMYLSASPGGFEQLSFYDAVRGELYRDFGDPIGMASRTLVEGLFGIEPDLLNNSITIQPGFPNDWKFASLTIPDISIDFKRNNNIDNYVIKNNFGKAVKLKFRVPAQLDSIVGVLVNGKKINWNLVDDAIELPIIELNIPENKLFQISITWQGKPFEKLAYKNNYSLADSIMLQYKIAKIIAVSDPQEALKNIDQSNSTIKSIVNAKGNKTFFLKLQQGQFSYWQPINFNSGFANKILPNENSSINKNTVFEQIELTNIFNDKVTNIFKQQYLSPRVKSPTLQLPTQGIGNWCYPLTQANINDEGLRKLAGNKNEILSPQGIPFATPSNASLNNIVFTSQWDNYPKQISISLSGFSSTAYLLMAGSTNAMQSQLVNALVIATYVDGTMDTLQLKNPENWPPIEQDYINDGFAFNTNATIPLRFYLQQGKFAYNADKYSSIKGFTSKAIDGGAATMLEFPLQIKKQLKSVSLQTLANDVVIGLMSITLKRN